MVHKDHVENFLRVNGIPSTAPEGDIREALKLAKWHDADVDTAVIVLRGDDLPNQALSLPVHRLLFTNQNIAPETLSSLLGVDINVTKDRLEERQHSREEVSEHTSIWIAITVLSFIVAFILGLLTMYVLNIGPFFAPVEQIHF